MSKTPESVKPTAAKAGKATSKTPEKVAPKASKQAVPVAPSRVRSEAGRSRSESRTIVRPERPHEKPKAPVTNLRSPFTKDELNKWREVLLARRTEIVSDIFDLEKDAMEAEDGHTTPLHAAERGSDAEMQEVSLGLAGEEKNLVWQIDRALRKIDKNLPLPFGICEHTREGISKNRLALIPWTPLSIEGATYLEENALTLEDLLLDD